MHARKIKESNLNGSEVQGEGADRLQLDNIQLLSVPSAVPLSWVKASSLAGCSQLFSQCTLHSCILLELFPLRMPNWEGSRRLSHVTHIWPTDQLKHSLPQQTLEGQILFSVAIPLHQRGRHQLSVSPEFQEMPADLSKWSLAWQGRKPSPPPPAQYLCHNKSLFQNPLQFPAYPNLHGVGQDAKSFN